MPRRDHIVNAFVADLARRNVDERFHAVYRAQVERLLTTLPDVRLAAYSIETVERFVERERIAGTAPRRLRNARLAAEAFIAWVGSLLPAALASFDGVAAEAESGGASPLRAASLDTPAAATSSTAWVADAAAGGVWSGMGAATAAAIASPLLLGFLGFPLDLIARCIHLGALFGYFSTLTDHVARGRVGLPHAGQDDLIGHLMRGIALFVASLSPCVLIALYGGAFGLGAAGIIGGALVAGVLGLYFVPAMLMVSYATGSVLAAVLPWGWTGIVSRLGRDYMRLAIRFVLVGLLMVAFSVLAGRLIPFATLAAFVQAAGVNLLAMSLAVSLGKTLAQYGEHFGFRPERVRAKNR